MPRKVPFSRVGYQQLATEEREDSFCGLNPEYASFNGSNRPKALHKSTAEQRMFVSRRRSASPSPTDGIEMGRPTSVGGRHTFVLKNVAASDTLEYIAVKYSCSLSLLKRLNKISSNAELQMLKNVKIPAAQHGILTELFASEWHGVEHNQKDPDIAGMANQKIKPEIARVLNHSSVQAIVHSSNNDEVNLGGSRSYESPSNPSLNFDRDATQLIVPAVEISSSNGAKSRRQREIEEATSWKTILAYTCLALTVLVGLPALVLIFLEEDFDHQHSHNHHR